MKNIRKYALPIFISLGIIVISLAIIFFIKRNSSKENSQINPMFAEYVSAITSGIISSGSTIKVVLVESYQGDSIKREEAIKNIFSFSPGISGTTRWFDDKTIEFVPTKSLQSGTKYTAKFKLSKVANVSENLSTLEFSFVIIKQDFSVSNEGLRTYPQNANNYFLQGTIKTADNIDNESIEKVLKAKLQETDLPIQWQHSENRLNHTFIIDSIKRTSEKQLLKLDWNGKVADIENSGSDELEVPAIGTFKVLDAIEVAGNEKFIKVIFSDPIDRNQDLNGLITIDNFSNLKFTIEDNIVKVYYENSQNKGSFQIQVSEGILNAKGDKLRDKFVKGVKSQEIKPAIEIIGKAVIMPNSGTITLPFRAVNLKAVDVSVIKIYAGNIPQFLQTNTLNGVRELKRVGRPVYRGRIDLATDHTIDYSLWNVFSIDLSKYVKADPGALYRVTISFRKAYSLYPCEEADSTVIQPNETPIAAKEKDDFSDYDVTDNDYYDSYSYYYEEGVYEEENYWQNRDNPCSKAYYYADRMASCNVLASNLGITAKMNKNNELNVIVTDINDAKPLSGIALDILDFQQQVIATVNTNSDGFASIKPDHRPFLVVAKRDKERGYLPLTGNSTLSLSTFDISGEEVQKGLKGFIYGERGVWRPGDTLFLTFILEDKNKTLPANHPIIFELSDPKGKLFKRLVKVSSTNGFYSIAVPTEEESPTGNWNVKIRAGGAVFNKTVKIETIKPNRLEINLDLTNGKAFAESNIHGTLNAKWLHGAIASNLKTRIAVSLSASTTSFKKYPGYVFDDPSRSCTSEEKVIYEGELDANGNANITAAIEPGSPAPGMLKAGFVTKVFEESGDFSIDYVSVPFSPYNKYVGLKTPVGTGYWEDMLFTDTTNTIKIATVDANGNPVSRSNVKVKVFKLEWRWWWDASDNDLASYFANQYRSPIIDKVVSTINGNGQFSFRVNSGDYGRYMIQVTDPDGHSCGKTVYLDWPGWASRSNSNNTSGASILTISTDKKLYKVGEKAVITIPSAGNGRALVSLESGSKILNMYWVDLAKSKGNRASIEIPITADFAPNVFVNVTVLQPHADTKNDAPLRLYGYTPLMVEDPATKLEPEISLPDQIGSEEQFTISVKEKNKKPMTYTIAVVDEGLLSLTRFKTPNPHPSFYAREALGIKTWDMFDLVFGAFGGKIEQVFGIGGDQDMASMKSKKNAERFKPVVKFIGPFTLSGGSTNSHKVKLPKYNGAVRVMLVAGQNAAYGCTDKSVKVKNSLMVVATMPRVLGPTENITMPVTIFVDEPSIKNANVEVQTNSMLSVLGSKTQSISFTKPGNQIINFDMKVAKLLGIARVKVIVTSGKYKADYEVELNVRNANPPISSYSGTIIQGGQHWNSDLAMLGMIGTNKATIELSSLPPMDLGRRLDYLIQYPHGCIEQTTSGVFPQLYLGDILDVTQDQQLHMEENVKAGINRIKGFQTSDGGLSYWPGQNESNEWGSNYGGHFLIEAEMKGYKLPVGLKQGWVKYQKSKARNNNGENTYYYYNDYGLTQAYRLYTLALAGEPELGAMNRLRERTTNSIQTKWMLAAAYLKVGQDAAAKELTTNLSTDIKAYDEMGYTYGSDLRDRAMILETYTLQKDFKHGSEMVEYIAKNLSSEYWYSTHTLGYCLIAISKYAIASGMTKGEMGFSYAVNGSVAKDVNTKKSVYQISPNVTNLAKANINISNKSKGSIYARIFLQGIPVAGEEKDAENNLSIQITYKDLKGNVLNIENLKQGTDFKADVTIRNTSSTEYYQNLALTQIVPSGWEIVNTRVGDIQNADNSELPDYQDIRDDRILSYFNLAKGTSKTFSFLFNATYLGNFYLPAISCEAMYDHKVYARKGGKWVKVVK